MFASTSVDARDLQKKLKSKAKKVKFEESHVKRTLWLTRENNDILNLERKNGDRISVLMKGEKTFIARDNSTNINSEEDPAHILFNNIGNKKEYAEDKRIRRTYWLTKKEIKMVEDLSKMTRMDKYEVVTVAIQSMYARAMDKKGGT